MKAKDDKIMKFIADFKEMASRTPGPDMVKARKAGFNPSTLSRMGQGGDMLASNLLKLIEVITGRFPFKIEKNELLSNLSSCAMSAPVRNLMEEALTLKSENDVVIVGMFLAIVKYRNIEGLIDQPLVETLINQVKNFHEVLMGKLKQKEGSLIFKKIKEKNDEEKILN